MIRYRPLQLPLIIAVAIVAGFVAVLPSKIAQAAPPSDCEDYQTLRHLDDSGFTACTAGLVCVVDACEAFDLRAITITPNATSITVLVRSIASLSHPIPMQKCLGTQAACGTPGTNDAAWDELGTPPGSSQNSWTVPFDGLRPGQTYNMSFYSTFEGQAGQLTVQGTTWPAPQFTPTVSGITQSAATVNWTTPFSGKTKVYYRVSPPAWTKDVTPSPSVQLTAVSATGSGKAWAVGGGGNVFMADPATGTWSVQTSAGPFYLKSVDAYDDQHVWAAGMGGNILHTTNGGATWTATTSGTSSIIYHITGAPNDTAWAVTETGQILFYNGVSWQVKYTNPALSLYSIATVDGKEIWAVGSSNSLVSSRDGGGTWSVASLPLGLAGETISTLNGQTLWIGGSYGELLKSTDRGTTWQSIPSGTTATIHDISLVSDGEFWFANELLVGRYKASATPTTSFFSQPSTLFSSSAFGVATINGSEVLAVGQTSQIARYGLTQGSNIYDPNTFSSTHIAGLTGLSQNTAFNYAAVSVDSGLTIGSGAFGTFTTTAPDTTAPIISFTTPSVNPLFTNASSMTIAGTATDNVAVSTISFQRTNGSNVTTTALTMAPTLPNAGPVIWSSLPVTLLAGTNTITATACDGSGNCATITSDVIVDTQAPTVSITDPTGGSTVGTASITATGSANDNDQVVTGEYQLNSNPRQSFTLIAGANPILSFSVGGLLLGSNTLTVFVKDRSGNEGSSGPITFNYAQPTFDLIVTNPIAINPNPPTRTLAAGQSTTYDVTLTPLYGFTGSVSLTLTGAPAGSTVTYNPPSPITLGAAAVPVIMTIQTASSPTGTFSMTLTATGTDQTSGNVVTVPKPVRLIITTPPNFILTSSTILPPIIAGGSANYVVNAIANTTYSGTVNGFSTAAAPTSPLTDLTTLTRSFSPVSVSLLVNESKQVVLTVATTGSTPNGTYILRVSARDSVNAAITAYVDITLVVSLPPSVDLTVLPDSLSITAGSGAAANYNGKAIAQNGYNLPSIVTATVGGVSTGLTITVNPSTFTPAGGAGSDFTLSIMADSRVPGGSYLVTVTLRSSDNSYTISKTVTLVVTGDTTPPIITINQADVNPNWDRVTIAWLTNELANTRFEIYPDQSRSTSPAIFSDPAYVTSHTPPTFTGLLPSTTYYLKVISTDQSPTPNTASTIVFSDGGSSLQFTTLAEPDDILPRITIVQPSYGQTVIGRTVHIIGTASDNQIVSTMSITIKRPDGSNALFQQFDPIAPSYDYDVTWDSLQDRINGNFTIEARATDSAGNKSLVVTSIMIVQNDVTPPEVDLGYPKDINHDCTEGPNRCKVTIWWFTDDASTSRVEYADETTYFGSGYELTADYDDSLPNTSPSVPIQTEHLVTLTNLAENQLYHYRIWSCNTSGDCTN